MAVTNELIVVVGLGKTGLSCVRHLVSKGHNVAVVDSRQAPPGLEELKAHYANVEVRLGPFDHDLLAKATELVVSPGVSLKEPAIAEQIQRNVSIAGDIELFAREMRKPVVAVTGSNGKSTVTSLIGHLAALAGLKVKVGGNLGIPALDLLDDDNTELYVLELSSFQLETTSSLNCLSAVNLNISPDHMDRYTDLEEYRQAKLRIYAHCKRPVVNLDDPKSYHGISFEAEPIGFSLAEPARGIYGLRSLNGETYLAYGDQNLLPTKSLRLKGQHQYANALAALAVGKAIGLSFDSMLKSIINFQGLPHRCQWLSKINGVDWYNDSKATNVGSSQAAIAGIGPEISGKLVLLAGGQGKNADFSDLVDSVKKYVKVLILYGEDKQIIADALQKAAPISMADDLAQATAIAKNIAQPGDVVILSPACASYDMFRNFEHRGEVFMELVRGLSH